MAVDKLVDSTQLNNSLSYEADRIRLKTGGSADIAFDFANEKGFGDAIDAIPTGGGGQFEEQIATGIYNGETVELAYTQIGKAFAQTSGAFSLRVPNATTGNNVPYLFENTTMTGFFAPKFTINGAVAFSRANSLVNVVVGKINSFSTFASSTLRRVDICLSGGKLDNTFSYSSGCPVLDTIILRPTSIVTLQNTSAFNNTPYKSGGTGGTIYIPKSLYDHLGDGTSLDYKAATNWATVNGYGTITWAQIEGSIYETQYADGTPIT